MDRVLHLFDSQTPPAGLEAMDCLRNRRGGDLAARVGPEGGRADLPVAEGVIRQPLPWTLTAAPGIRRFADRQDAKAIHCWSCALAEPAAAIGRPTCVSLFRPPNSIEAHALRRTVADGATVLACSETLARVLADLGLPADRVRVVPPSADVVRPDPTTREQARRRLALPAGLCVMISVSQWDDDIGPYHALWALGILQQVSDEFHLLVVGHGSGVERAGRLAETALLAGRTTFVGRSESQWAWSAADVAVLADPAGYGVLSACRAAVAGVHIVAAHAGELADLLVHEQTALLAEPSCPRLLAQAVWRLRQDEQLSRRLAANAAASLAGLSDADAFPARMETLYAASRTPCGATTNRS